MAAMGETYFCTSTAGTAIDDNGVVNPDLPVQSWIVDSSRGLRIPELDGVAKDYIGECEIKLAVGVWCTAKHGILSQKNHIEVHKRLNEDITFMASIFGAAYNFAFFGSCTEI